MTRLDQSRANENIWWIIIKDSSCVWRFFSVLFSISVVFPQIPYLFFLSSSSATPYIKYVLSMFCFQVNALRYLLHPLSVLRACISDILRSSFDMLPFNMLCTRLKHWKWHFFLVISGRNSKQIVTTDLKWLKKLWTLHVSQFCPILV